MAVQTKTKDTRLKVKKAKPKIEETAKTGQDSDDRMKPMAQHQDRGIGSAFAYATAQLLKEAPDLKGSQNAFLGVPSETLDPTIYAHSLIKKD